MINHSFNVPGYWFGYLFGLLQWAICAAALFLLYIAITTGNREKLIKTVEAFFIINILASLLQLMLIMIASKSIFPYWLYDEAGRYGVSTGDKLFGIVFNNSINNSAISTIGGIYFLFNKKVKLALICMLVMVLCTSNLSVIIALFTLTIAFIFIREKDSRKKIAITVLFLLIVYPTVSPVNLQYISTIFKTFVLHDATKYENPDSFKVLGRNPVLERQNDSLKKLGIKTSEISMKYHLLINENDSFTSVSRLKQLKKQNDKYININSNVAIVQSVLKRSFFLIYGVPVEESPLTIYSKPGKVYSFKQTFYFLGSNFRNLLFGAGMGNFSSKLAVKMTGLELQGKYPIQYVYVSKPFVENHLYTILYYLSKNVALHSVLNMPNSVYNQIAGEYGLIGIILFVVLYVGYWWKKSTRYGYGKYLIIVLLLFFGMDYWFEMASLTVIFELLMLMDIFVYTNSNADNPPPGNSAHADV